jgi:putative N-acetyltransferase (TIGR04045 family)
MLTSIEGAPAVAAQFETRIARTEREREAYFALRRAIFCEEQGLFAGDDRDASDEAAIPIVCLATPPGGRPQVVGVVRIWEEAPGDWWGGRLGVDPAFRTVGAVGRWLVQTAVGSARAWGAWRFRATVQQPNVVFFRRLRWRSCGAMEILGRPHHLMEADLDHYTPTSETRPAAGEDGGGDARGACDDAA